MIPPKVREPVTLLSDRVYTIVRQAATIILPAVGALYFTLAQIWDWPNADKVVGSIAALNLFAGGLTSVAQRVYNSSGAKYQGTIVVEEKEGGTQMRLKEYDPLVLLDSDQITFKIEK